MSVWITTLILTYIFYFLFSCLLFKFAISESPHSCQNIFHPPPRLISSQPSKFWAEQKFEKLSFIWLYKEGKHSLLCLHGRFLALLDEILGSVIS